MGHILDTLPVLHRLALAYAPKRSRAAFLALLALDARLAEVVRSASEPMLAQIRLAWWRDILAREGEDRPQGEPLVAALGDWAHGATDLVALVDGWECLVDEGPLTTDGIRAFCEGRGAAFAALANVVECPEASEAARSAGQAWALADLASRLDNPHEREAAMAIVREGEWRRIALPRALRPLAVLHGLAASDGRAGRGLSQPRASMLFFAMRIGLFGR